MNKFAIELLQLIFSLLSQNQIAQCSRVCRSWYIAARDPLYHSIQFYSLDRVLTFINMTPTSSAIEDTDTSIIRYMKTIPRGFLVRKMTFHIQIKQTATWSELQTLCPRVTAVDMIPENDHGLYGVCRHRYRHPLALKWKELKCLPVWHKDDVRLWKSILSDQLLYLGLDTYFYDHLVKADDESSSSSSSTNTFITKTLQLPSMQCLQELDLYASRHFFLLDERSFENIHAACPNLRTFSLMSFQMHTTNHSTYITPTKLTSLHLDRCCIHDLTSYTYLGRKYPNLKSFKVKEIRKGSHPSIDAGDHRSAIFSLISKNFTQLTTISADLYELLDSHFLPSPSESIWPYTEIQQWLMKKTSSNITTLHWSGSLPLDPPLADIDDDDDDSHHQKVASPQQQRPLLESAVFEFPKRFCFSRLTSLLLITPSNASWQQVQQLWSSKQNNTHPVLPVLKTLIIRHTLTDNSNNITANHHSGGGTCFPRRKKQDILTLARACPKLTRLEIENGLIVPENTTGVFPSLQDLIISNCLISLKKNVADVCKACPHLKSLSLKNVQCQLESRSSSSSSSTAASSSYDSDMCFIPTKESGCSFILQVDLPLHSLEYLELSNLWYERMMSLDPRYTRRAAVNAITVINQASMGNYYRKIIDVGKPSMMTQVFVIFKYQYVEQAIIKHDKYT